MTRAGWIAALAVALVSGAAGAWPKVPLPEGSTGEAVSEHMSFNGMDMRASTFRTPLKLDDVVAFYARAWGKQHNVTKHEQSTIVGHPEGNYFVTVELTSSGGGTKGTIGIIKAPDKGESPELGKGLYRPAGTEVLSDIVHNDTPSRSRTVVMRNRLSPYINQQHYSRRMGGDGWRETVSGRCMPASPECVVRYERGSGDRMAMTLSREAGRDTAIVVNIE